MGRTQERTGAMNGGAECKGEESMCMEEMFFSRFEDIDLSSLKVLELCWQKSAL